MNKIVSILKRPETWVIFVVGVIAAGAYSALRKPFRAISTKLPGADITS